MTPQAFIKKHLTACEYPLHLDSRAKHDAKEHGLVIVYGASDDLMEFEGVIDDEIGAYEGKEVQITAAGKILLSQDVEELAAALNTIKEFCGKAPELPSTRSIKAMLGGCAPDGRECSWHYVTDIPHATFDVMEDGELYCIGIVFRLADLSADPNQGQLPL